MAADTIRFIVTVAIVIYKGLIPVVYRMLTKEKLNQDMENLAARLNNVEEFAGCTI